METDAQTPEVAPEITSAESLRGARPGTDANTFIMTAFGIVATLIVSFGVMPLKGTKADYLYGIVNQRGPVQYLELLMSFMVVAMLMLKSRIVNRNLRVISSNPIPHDLDLNNDEGLQEFRASLPQRPEFAWSILLNRLDRAVALWLGSKDVGRVATWAQSESSRDQGSSDSSYALSRVLMWAIPILGFAPIVCWRLSCSSLRAPETGPGSRRRHPNHTSRRRRISVRARLVCVSASDSGWSQAKATA